MNISDINIGCSYWQLINEMNGILAQIKSCGGIWRSDLIEVHEFNDDTGRGIAAKQNIQKGTVLVEIPLSCTVSRSNLHNLVTENSSLNLEKHEFESDFDYVVYFMMWALRNKDKLKEWFQEYLNMLPRIGAGPAALHQSIFWTPEELELIRGTDSYMIAERLKTQLVGDFAQMEVDDECTFEDYKLALGILWSRCMDFQMENGSCLRVLAPMADLFNADISLDISHQYNIATSSVMVLASKDYAPGEQVFISYRPPDNRLANAQLLQTYGFVIRPPRNVTADFVQLYAPMSESSPVFPQVLALGINPACQPFLLSEANPVPEILIKVLHLQRGVEMISTSVLLELREALQSRKASYFNQGDRNADLALLMKERELPHRSRMALYIRLSETRIIDRAIARLNTMIDE